MLSNRINFSYCVIWNSFPKSSYNYIVLPKQPTVPENDASRYTTRFPAIRLCGPKHIVSEPRCNIYTHSSYIIFSPVSLQLLLQSVIGLLQIQHRYLCFLKIYLLEDTGAARDITGLNDATDTRKSTNQRAKQKNG